MPKGKKAGKKGGAAPRGGGEEEKKGGNGKLGTCNTVRARHILCEKESKILMAYNQLTEAHGNRPPVQAFAELAKTFSECPSSKKGGDLGWFGRGKMVGAF
jgi:NIMA-interacting peptidyl-prolyl cis-trans isomerase 4